MGGSGMQTDGRGSSLADKLIWVNVSFALIKHQALLKISQLGLKSVSLMATVVWTSCRMTLP